MRTKLAKLRGKEEHVSLMVLAWLAQDQICGSYTPKH